MDRSYLKNSRLRLRSKVHADEKAQHTREYVSILRRFATQPLSVRCIFEMASNKNCDILLNTKDGP